jgi:hypothetical protein
MVCDGVCLCVMVCVCVCMYMFICICVYFDCVRYFFFFVVCQ